MILAFAHDTLPQRVVFGAGKASRRLGEELTALRARRPMLITSRLDKVGHVIAGLEIRLTWPEVAQHVPRELLARALHAAADAEVDVIVAIGGGSAIGLAKGIARDTAIPIIAIPTTFAGSEATDVWGITTGDVKTTGSSPHVLPKTVIYDADLLATIPIDLARASAMNAIAHCVDSLWAPHADPINAALADEATTALAAGIRSLVSARVTTSAIETMQYGAYLAAVAFASAGSGLHHKICHVLGGAFDLPHAATHSVVLPYVLALNIAGAPDAERRLRVALGVEDALSGILQLQAQADTPRSLKELGHRRIDIQSAAQMILPAVPASNPRPVDEPTLVRLLMAAWEGKDPTEMRRI